MLAYASYLLPSGVSQRAEFPNSDRALTLSARGRVLRRTSFQSVMCEYMIIVYVFTHYALCKDINLFEHSLSDDLISISGLGPKTVILGILI